MIVSDLIVILDGAPADDAKAITSGLFADSTG
jgi:hypothetical protein